MKNSVVRHGVKVFEHLKTIQDLVLSLISYLQLPPLYYYLELSVISSLETQIKHWFSLQPDKAHLVNVLVILGEGRCVLRYLWIGKINDDTSVRSKHIQTNI